MYFLLVENKIKKEGCVVMDLTSYYVLYHYWEEAGSPYDLTEILAVSNDKDKLEKLAKKFLMGNTTKKSHTVKYDRIQFVTSGQSFGYEGKSEEHVLVIEEFVDMSLDKYVEKFGIIDPTDDPEYQKYLELKEKFKNF